LTIICGIRRIYKNNILCLLCCKNWDKGKSICRTPPLKKRIADATKNHIADLIEKRIADATKKTHRRSPRKSQRDPAKKNASKVKVKRMRSFILSAEFSFDFYVNWYHYMLMVKDTLESRSDFHVLLIRSTSKSAHKRSQLSILLSR
jgi:hypothetical protein